MRNHLRMASLLCAIWLGWFPALSAQVVPSGQDSTSSPAPAETADRATNATSGSRPEVLFRTESGDLIPLDRLLNPDVVTEILSRTAEQRNVPRYSIAEMDIQGTIEKDVVRLSVELDVQVRAEKEWVAVPIAFGDVYLTKFDHSSENKNADAVLATAEQNARRWYLYGAGLHTLKFDLVGKTRAVSPGVSQLVLSPPVSTASHAVLEFAGPVEIQKLPAGSVPTMTRDDKGVRTIEFWGLDNAFSLTWATVAPQVALRPNLRAENRLKLDLTTIPVNLTGTQALEISGSPVSEVRVNYPEGFKLVRVDARNAAGVSVLHHYEQPSPGGPTATVVTLTSAVEGVLNLSFEMELENRTFPQDIRVAIPSLQDANVQTGDVDILIPTGLVVQQTRIEGAQRRRVTAETDQSVAATAFRLRSPESNIVLHVEETEAQFALENELRVTPSAETVALDVRYRISVTKGALQELAVEWPGLVSGGWQLRSGNCTLISGKEKTPTALVFSETEPHVLNVTFPERQSGEFVVEFGAVANLEDVRSGKVTLQCPQIRGAQRAPFLIRTVESDAHSVVPMRVGPDGKLQAIGRSAMEKSLESTESGAAVWFLDDPSFPVRFELPSQSARIIASVSAGLTPTSQGIEVRETINFNVEHRDLDGISLRIPDSVTPIVRLRGVDEPLRATLEGQGIWNFRLMPPRRGLLLVDVSYLYADVQQSGSGKETSLKVPLVTPDNAAEVRGIQVGTAALSGLEVNDKDVWKPVFSESFDLAWQTTQTTPAVPVLWKDRPTGQTLVSPDLLLARTQIIGRQAITTLRASYETLPDFVTVEVPSTLQLEAIVWNGQSLTSGNASRGKIQAQTIASRNVVLWTIAARQINTTTTGSVSLEVRTRQKLSSSGTPWRKMAFERPAVVGESAAVPVLWCVGSQDEYRLAGARGAYISLTQQSAVVIPGGETVRTLADRQVAAILSPFPETLKASAGKQMEEWLSVEGRQDLYFASADSGPLVLYLVPGVSLLLASALICVVFFLLMTLVRQVSLIAPVLLMSCVILVAWLLEPEWTLMLIPYVAGGLLCGVVSVAFQRFVSDRRLRVQGLPAATGELPTVFGYTEMLEASGQGRREQGSANVGTGSAEFSLGTSR
ncbi:MAG: hypothetical protein JNM43_11735 [Planctomycetaceae bacterium]|nr:hypothetical protein [Planctomycetaceae bacterium]